MGKAPVTPEVRGKPVAFVRVPDKGVPSAPPETTRVADNGIVVPFTEVTLGKEVVAEVISVALAGILVPLTVVRLGSEVVAVVTKVADEGIVVPLIDVAVATSNDGVVKLGLTNGALAARSVVRFVTCDSAIAIVVFEAEVTRPSAPMAMAGTAVAEP